MSVTKIKESGRNLCERIKIEYEANKVNVLFVMGIIITFSMNNLHLSDTSTIYNLREINFRKKLISSILRKNFMNHILFLTCKKKPLLKKGEAKFTL